MPCLAHEARRQALMNTTQAIQRRPQRSHRCGRPYERGQERPHGSVRLFLRRFLVGVEVGFFELPAMREELFDLLVGHRVRELVEDVAEVFVEVDVV